VKEHTIMEVNIQFYLFWILQARSMFPAFIKIIKFNILGLAK